MLESLTFGLAVVGYAGLAGTALMAARGYLPLRLLRAVAVVIVAHVLLVWGARYEWSFAEATRNGYAGFLIFHSALAAIVAATFVGGRLARRLVIAAFIVVSMGALGAVVRYEVVHRFRVPVVLIAVAGTFGLLHAAWLRRSRARAALG